MKAASRKETIDLMEPLVLSPGSRHRTELLDQVVVLTHKSAVLKSSLPEGVVTAVADLVRSMNCYYSNLIEGHNTHPVDIERALKKDYASDAKQRNLQLEAAAHITVQKWIDAGGLAGRATTIDGIAETHRRFCELLPKELLRVEHPTTKELIRVGPGALREHHVQVGRHTPVGPEALPRFLKRFEEVYCGLGPSESILATAAAHHRLAWIHPFMDGNGRVIRLMSHATMLERLDTRGIWSIARGLSRNVDRYKRHLANCDLPRRNDLDGRGRLSEEALSEFTRFFLQICIDQVDFMLETLQPDRLRSRIKVWINEEIEIGDLHKKSGAVLDAILFRGALPRGEVAELVGASGRTATRIVAGLIERGAVTSDSAKAPLRIAFPAALASRWMPGLFPAATEQRPSPD